MMSLAKSTQNRPWTAAEEEKLRELWLAGTTVTLIGRMLDRRGRGVGQKASRLGLPPRYRYNPDIGPKEVEPTKEKKCLKCRQPFQASRYIFICKGCKHNVRRWRGITI